MHFAKKCNVLKIQMCRKSGRARTTFILELHWVSHVLIALLAHLVSALWRGG